jgi:hypothetical protein
MNDFQIRAFVRELISEAKAKKADKKKEDKKEPKLPKSSGKLMDLKKEIAYLKEMSSQLQATGLNEVEQDTKVEFANLQKFVSELAKVKEAGADLKKKLDDEIKSIEEKIKAEKAKIKEMIGLASAPTMVDEKKMTSAQKNKKEDIVKGMKKSDSFGKSKEEKEQILKAISGQITKSKGIEN